MSAEIFPDALRLRLRKLPARAHIVVMPMILSLLMSGVVSSISTIKVIGLADVTAERLLQAWGISYMIAFPTALLVMPIVRRVVALLVESPANAKDSGK
jgi:energy-converting hydrogenase Eha subunit A